MIYGINDVYNKYANSEEWYNENVKNIWSIINLVLIICYILFKKINYTSIKWKN